MNLLKNQRMRTVMIYLLAVLIVSLVIILMSPEDGPLQGSRLLLTIGVIILALLPVAYLSHKWRNLMEGSQVFSLKEYSLTEEELKSAVRNWVYCQKQQGPEGEITFHFDDEGQLFCRYNLPED